MTLSKLLEKASKMKTSTDNKHYHYAEVDKKGNGETTMTIDGERHTHKINNFEVEEAFGHTHILG